MTENHNRSLAKTPSDVVCVVASGEMTRHELAGFKPVVLTTILFLLFQIILQHIAATVWPFMVTSLYYLRHNRCPTHGCCTYTEVKVTRCRRTLSVMTRRRQTLYSDRCRVLSENGIPCYTTTIKYTLPARQFVFIRLNNVIKCR